VPLALHLQATTGPTQAKLPFLLLFREMLERCTLLLQSNCVIVLGQRRLKRVCEIIKR
jgi:hypothetical protein